MRPVRPAESLEGYKVVPVTLANGQNYEAPHDPWEHHGLQPVGYRANFAMGLLVERLGCKVDRGKDGVQVQHPYGGLLHIRVSGGCPQ